MIGPKDQQIVVVRGRSKPGFKRYRPGRFLNRLCTDPETILTFTFRIGSSFITSLCLSLPKRYRPGRFLNRLCTDPKFFMIHLTKRYLFFSPPLGPGHWVLSPRCLVLGFHGAWYQHYNCKKYFHSIYKYFPT